MPQVWSASVSYEFDLQPVLTHKCQVEAIQPGSAANRAAREARRQFKGKKPRSIVIVLEKMKSLDT